MTATHLRLLDERAARLVTALLIRGSVALEDYHAGTSDLDFVAVTDHEPSPDQLSALEQVHRSMPRRPEYDGIYLTRDQLMRSPQAADTAPQVLAGTFDPAKPGGELTPVTWLELERYAIPVRGQRPAVKNDEGALRRYLEGNLAGYWTQWTQTARTHWASRPPDEPVFQDHLIWGVLGPPRLRYTLLTGDIISKTAAGHFAAQRYPAWQQLCERVVRGRAGEVVGFTAADGVAAAELMTVVIAG